MTRNSTRETVPCGLAQGQPRNGAPSGLLTGQALRVHEGGRSLPPCPMGPEGPRSKARSSLLTLELKRKFHSSPPPIPLLSPTLSSSRRCIWTTESKIGARFSGFRAWLSHLPHLQDGGAVVVGGRWWPPQTPPLPRAPGRSHPGRLSLADVGRPPSLCPLCLLARCDPVYWLDPSRSDRPSLPWTFAWR